MDRSLSKSGSSIFLVDNGSLRPEATLALRGLAQALSEQSGHPIEPVSLLHSHKIPAGQLDGQPATIVKRRMRELMQSGHRDFVLLPLFLGPSLAITDYLPTVIEDLRKEQVDLEVRIALPLAGADVEQPDARLARMLADHLEVFLTDSGLVRFALIDHGTPFEPVNRLRNAVARQLSHRLGQAVQPCSMERREGPEYAFNDPLLEHLGEMESYRGCDLRLAMFFLLPGRHAGAGGDVAQIAGTLLENGALRSVRMSPLLWEHPLLLDILSERLAEVMAQPAASCRS